MGPRQQKREIATIIDRLGLSEACEIIKNSRHYRVIVSNGERSAFVTVAGSPSCPRSNLNFRAILRRTAAEIGLVTA